MNCLERIKELLELRGWTMYTLSQKSGIPQSTLSNLFIRCNSPSIATLEKICAAFGITPAQFFRSEEDGMDEKEARLLEIWHGLSPELQEHLLALLMELGH